MHAAPVKLIAYNVQLRSVLSNKAGRPFVCLDHHRCCTLHGMPGQGLIFRRLINHHKEGSKLHTTLVVNLVTRRSDCQMASERERDDKYWPAAERQGPGPGERRLEHRQDPARVSARREVRMCRQSANLDAQLRLNRSDLHAYHGLSYLLDAACSEV